MSCTVWFAIKMDGKDLFEQLFVDGVHLATKIIKNMKNCLMLLQDRTTLKKRALIETVNIS